LSPSCETNLNALHLSRHVCGGLDGDGVAPGRSGGRGIDALIEDIGIETIAFDQAQAKVTREAFRRFGKGRHRAALNLGDCFVYALAKILAAPLLFKRDDFVLTDVKRAL
jgi:ribonuclease VapC